MSIAERIKEVLGEPLEVVAKNLEYNKSNIYILKNKMLELKEECPQIYSNLESCGHQRDGRTKEQYAKDLIASWIFEDIFLKKLKTAKLNINLNGADKEREILSTSQTQTTSDYIIKKDDKEINIELMCSYTNYWKNTKKIDLRDNKYNTMASKEVLLLCIDMYNKEFFIIDIKNSNATFLQQHPIWKKPAYSINLNSITTQKYDINEIAKALESSLL
jgi:hypothetical protein